MFIVKWRGRAAIMIALAVIFLTPAAASDVVLFAPRPDFVVPLEPPPFSDEDRKQAKDGVAYLLIDTQVMLSGDEDVTYRRTVKRVTDAAGLEDTGRFEFKFDPAQEAFTVHAIRIRRGGEIIDRLDPEGFSILRREEDLAAGQIDGDLTAYFEISDLRVGDEVDTETSWRTRSALWPGEYFADVSVEWSSAVARFQRRITAPAAKPLTIVNYGAPPAPDVTRADGKITYVWRREATPATRGEDAIPVTYPVWSKVFVSTFDAWRDVVDSLAPAYDARAVLPEALKTRFATGDLNRRITDAVRYVEDDIRYVADAVGVGSHLPRLPGTVVERGWGDCKDKSLLLVSLLRNMGVEAYVALTDIDEGNALALLAPSPYAFDHAIVLAVIDGAPHWIDATKSHQGGVFPAIAPPAVGAALPLKAGVDALWPVASPSDDAPEQKTTEIFDFADRDGAGVTLATTTTYRVEDADWFRKTQAQQGAQAQAADYLKYYAGLYPGITAVGEIEIADDRDANVIVIREHYLLPKEAFAADGLNAAFPVQADAVRNRLNAINAATRTAPIALPFPVHVEHVAQLKNTGVKMAGVEEFASRTPEIEYELNAMPEGESVYITWRLRTLAPEVPAARIADYGKINDALDDWSRVEYDLTGDEAIEPWGLAALVAIIALLLTGGLAFAAFSRALRDDAKTREGAFLYPVSPVKFVVLGVVTAGVYPAYWMYRCWRRAKFALDLNISPIGRAIFAIFFYYPLFRLIREESPDAARPPVAAGAALTILYLVSVIAMRAITRLSEATGLEGLALTIADVAPFLFILPLVLWVNRANKDRPDIIAAHSRWTIRTLAAVAFGASLWALIIAGSFAPA